ncbi:MAG: patatin-like phospholipase family protein [Imperialibacter sp.]|uniref:patatin-like phospholipase family protein n=1 Tax=Imperialibacter sp. TaxID=2038411 RepID=UPI0032ECA59D
MHVRRNLFMLFFWVSLVAVFTGNFGRILGIPYLFLDPEYLNRVDFWSFFIVGFCMGGFTAAFNISCYILYGHEYSFLGVLERPFTKFSINNSLLPIIVNVAYLVFIFQFQMENEFRGPGDLFWKILGYLAGFLGMLAVLYTYFRLTNKDIFKYLTGSVDKRLKKVKVNRKRALDKLKEVRESKNRVDFYWDEKFRLRPTAYINDFYDKEAILKVFDQNHFNLVLIELLIIVVVLLLGFFMDNPYFQIPAAASAILFGTIFIMLSGAISYWFRSWGLIFSITAFLLLNFLVKMDVFRSLNPAFGLNYKGSRAEYSIKTLSDRNTPEVYNQDVESMLPVLEKWKAKQKGAGKPKMVFLCVSGGGQRAALWTMRVMQQMDSLLNGTLLDNTMMITGASGGIVGAAYYRELFLREKSGEIENRMEDQYLSKIAMDNLNPMIFSLLVNDMFIRFQYFRYDGEVYLKDRGYAFENQLNRNTDMIMEKKLKDYQEAESNAEVPLLLMAPTIVNDGRKLYISTQDVGFMTSNAASTNAELVTKVRGVDFRSFFKEQNADELRFLSALRMSATFPYITPNIELPSDPPLEIMDAGISDNYGISDAVRFVYVFREWIEENTSGVVIFSVRDHQKNAEIEKKASESIVQKFSSPISSVYNNLGNIQDLNNDSRIEFATEWFKGNLYQIEVEYNTNTMFQGESNLPEEVLLERKQNERASLNWHLTTREKKNIIDNINLVSNQQALMRLKELLEAEEEEEE